MDFLWTKGVSHTEKPALEGDRNTDVLVIGGGMAGVLCALKLQQAGADCILAEAASLGSGMTRGTTAVLTAQHDKLYQDMIKDMGGEKAALYLEANLKAVESFRALAGGMDCDLEERPSVMYSLNDLPLMEKEAAAVRSLGFPAELIMDTPLPFPVAGAVRYPGMAQFHPLKFLYAAAGELCVFEHTLVQRLEGTVAFTPHGRIRAKKVIVATHFPFIDKRGLYFMKLHQQRSYVIALENAPELGCTIEDSAENGIFLRNYKELLLVGGGTHRTGKKGGGFSVPREFARRYFPEAREKYSWANQDCVSLDGVPYIGSYSPAMPNVLVATGFNLWGMTTSMVAADILSDMALERENRFAAVFSPDRSLMKAQLFSNLGSSALDYATPTAKRCTHLGCALKFNSDERSYDCPCHGSRFSESGRLLNGPAIKSCKALRPKSGQ